MTRAAALLLALGLLAGPAAAQPESEPEWSYRLWRELMSPYCPGRSLADCPSSQAETLRTWILVQEAAGRSRADVEGELLERFGDVILPAPRARGIGIAAYLIPVVVFVAGGILLGVFLRRQTRAAPRAPLTPGPVERLDPELERALDDELAG